MSDTILKEYSFTLDFVKRKSVPRIEVVSGDLNSTVITIKLTNNDKPIDLTGSTVSLIIKKPDDTVNITNVETISTDTVKYTLETSVTTISGTHFVELSVYEDTTKTTVSSNFTYIVKDSLDNGEGVQSDNEYPFLAGIIMSENARVNAENIREQDEFNRETYEDLRKSNETSRVNSESSRVSAENTRVLNENNRVSDESLRVTAENNRVSSENIRQTNETNRQNAENLRQSTFNGNETARHELFVSNETDRQYTFDTNESNRTSAFNANETARQNNEGDNTKGRIKAESDRVAAENSRVTAETNRTNAENSRVTAELSRVTAENNRVSAESARVTAENQRVSEWNTIKDTYLGSTVGDMKKIIYDSNNSGVVDDSEKLGGQLPSYYETVTHSNSNLQAAKDYADNQINALKGSAPALMDTLIEVDNALNNDPDAFNTLMTAAQTKADTAEANAKAYTDYLAGVGNTKTVKQVSDNIDTHLAEKSTQTDLGHVIVDNNTIKVQEDGTIYIPQPSNANRLQSKVGWDSPTLSQVVNNSGVLSIGSATNNTANNSTSLGGSEYGIYQANGQRGVKISATVTATLDYISYYDVYTGSCPGAPTTKFTVYDNTDKVVIDQQTKGAPYTANSSFRITVNKPVTRGHEIIIWADPMTNGSSSLYWSWKTSLVNISSYGMQHIHGGTYASGWTGSSSDFLALNVTGLTYLTSGSAEQIISPADVTKWGLITFDSNIPANTSLNATITDINNNVLFSNVQSGLDLSSVDANVYKSLKLKFTFSTSIVGTSPTVSNPIFNWQGYNIFINGDGAWEKICDATLSGSVSQIDFKELGNYKVFKIMGLHTISSTTTNMDMYIRFNDDTGTSYSSNDGALTSLGFYMVNTVETSNNGMHGKFFECTITNISTRYKKIFLVGGDISIQRGHWTGTSLIKKISLIPGSGTIQAGAEFIIWGCR